MTTIAPLYHCIRDMLIHSLESLQKGVHSKILHQDLAKFPMFDQRSLGKCPILWVDCIMNTIDMEFVNSVYQKMILDQKGMFLGIFEEVAAMSTMSIIYFRMAFREMNFKIRCEYVNRGTTLHKMLTDWDNGGKNFEFYFTISNAFLKCFELSENSRKLPRIESFQLLHYFTEAIEKSSENSSIKNIAMAQEYTYEFCKLFHLQPIDTIFLLESITSYTAWGATYKAQQLQDILRMSPPGVLMATPSPKFPFKFLHHYTKAAIKAYQGLPTSIQGNDDFQTFSGIFGVYTNVAGGWSESGGITTNLATSRIATLALDENDSVSGSEAESGMASSDPIVLFDWLSDVQSHFSYMFQRDMKQLNIIVAGICPKVFLGNRLQLQILVMSLLIAFVRSDTKEVKNIFLSLMLEKINHSEANFVIEITDYLPHSSSSKQNITPINHPSDISEAIKFIDNVSNGTCYTKIHFSQLSLGQILQVYVPIEANDKIAMFMEKDTIVTQCVFQQLTQFGVEPVLLNNTPRVSQPFKVLIVDESVSEIKLVGYKRQSPGSKVVLIGSHKKEGGVYDRVIPMGKLYLLQQVI